MSFENSANCFLANQSIHHALNFLSGMSKAGGEIAPCTYRIPAGLCVR
jgi:hypothetical protein